MKYKRFLSFLITFVLFSESFVVFCTDLRIVAENYTHPISPGLEYSSRTELYNGIRQEIYSFTYTPGDKTEIVPAYGDYIYGFNSVGSLVDSYKGEGRVVGAINTDFFITNTGIPLSCLVKDGEIISSCDNRAAIGFDNDGKAYIGYPEIAASLNSEALTVQIAHINKTPGVWGAYLLTDRFSKTTKTSFECFEIILKCYNAEETKKNLEALKDDEDINIEEIFQDEDETNSSVESNNSDVEHNDCNSQENEKNSFDEVKIDTLNNPINSVFDDILDELDDDYIDEINTQGNSEDIVTNKEVEALDNDITKESDAYDNENDSEDNSEDNSPSMEPPSFEHFAFEYSPLTLDCDIDVVVTEIRTESVNGEIPDDSFVLCVPKSLSYLVHGIEVGNCFNLSIDSNEMINQCSSVFGAGSIIVDNGEAVKQTNDSIFIYRNPRTAAGILSDGRVVFLCVDGRRQGESSGFTIKELSEYLISLGCVSAVNFDGGGSTTFYAACIGEENSVIKNIPSDGSERRVADGLLFVNNSEESHKRAYATSDRNSFLLFNKSSYLDISGDITFADSNFYPITLGTDEKVELYVDEGYGFTYNNIFIPNGKTGRAEISVYITDTDERYSVGVVEITDTVDKMNLKSESTRLSPFDDSVMLSHNASLNTIPVSFTPHSVEWEISYLENSSKNIENDSSDANEKQYVTADESEAYIYHHGDDVYFIPVKRDVDYLITASMGKYSESVKIFADEHPFNDMLLHWAEKTSYDMFKEGFILGEVCDDGIRRFFPSRTMTIAEFCAVLARILKLEITYEEHDNGVSDITNSNEKISSENNKDVNDVDFEEKTENAVEKEDDKGTSLEILSDEIISNDDADFVEDISETDNENSVDAENIETLPPSILSNTPSWAKGYVFALYNGGYIDSLTAFDEEGEITVYADKSITRMDVVRVFGSILDFDSMSENIQDFSDFVPERENDELYLSRVVESGLISGYEDGTVRVSSALTRAEAATIFSRFINLD